MAKSKKLKRPVLAEGESTGHAHVLEDEAIEVEIREDGVREFAPSKPTKLNHEEHNAVVLPAQELCSDIVRESDPFEGERRVQD